MVEKRRRKGNSLMVTDDLVYCKYCYEDVLPEFGDGLVQCSECLSGLAPLDAFEDAGGSWAEWESSLNQRYPESMDNTKNP